MTQDDVAKRIWSRMIEPEKADLSPEVANHLLSVSCSAAEVDRVEELSHKVKDRSLSPDERSELETYLHVNAFLIVMKCKARATLASLGPKEPVNVQPDLGAQHEPIE